MAPSISWNTLRILPVCSHWKLLPLGILNTLVATIISLYKFSGDAFFFYCMFGVLVLTYAALAMDRKSECTHTLFKEHWSFSHRAHAVPWCGNPFFMVLLLFWWYLNMFLLFNHPVPPPPPPQPGSAAHLALVREAANFKLKYGRKKEAISDLEQLWKWVESLRKVWHVWSVWVEKKKIQCAP